MSLQEPPELFEFVLGGQMFSGFFPCFHVFCPEGKAGLRVNCSFVPPACSWDLLLGSRTRESLRRKTGLSALVFLPVPKY